MMRGVQHPAFFFQESPLISFLFAALPLSDFFWAIP